jgi:HD-GYP domain-containing protein (c-di-GMP phosphodiesterase class II)
VAEVAEIITKLEDSSMDILEDCLTDLRDTGSESIQALPPDDLRTCLYMATLRVLEFLRRQAGGEGDDRPTSDFKAIFLEGAARIVDAVDNSSPYTTGHARAVATYAGQLAARARLTDAQIEDVEYAARIHNIGRINEAPDLTASTRRLSDSELTQARDHCVVGAEILRPISFLTPIVPMVRHHHTRYDGTGHASGVRGEDIPLGARIVSIADAYNAMRSDRPYRTALSREETILEIDKNAGRQFDPKLVPFVHDL